uniref:Uncharacterized protein n=1 Tax=Anguilla anguilla TaxID=7936 RepID=A0A0E9SHT5_ANGAN
MYIKRCLATLSAWMQKPSCPLNRCMKSFCLGQTRQKLLVCVNYPNHLILGL